jgi:hypothetical protein
MRERKIYDFLSLISEEKKVYHKVGLVLIEILTTKYSHRIS